MGLIEKKKPRTENAINKLFIPINPQLQIVLRGYLLK